LSGVDGAGRALELDVLVELSGPCNGGPFGPDGVVGLGHQGCEDLVEPEQGESAGSLSPEYPGLSVQLTCYMI
jgi:hypothetical protein